MLFAHCFGFCVLIVVCCLLACVCCLSVGVLVCVGCLFGLWYSVLGVRCLLVCSVVFVVGCWLLCVDCCLLFVVWSFAVGVWCVVLLVCCFVLAYYLWIIH